MRTAERTAVTASDSVRADNGAGAASVGSAPTASSILAMALRAASGSTVPGMSSSARSATNSAVASGEVRRSGRSMPAEKVTSMLSSEKDRSIRSPGPYPGSPHIHSWFRSAISCLVVTPRSAAASAALIPGLAWKYGTMFSSRVSLFDSSVMR
ncbi:Uncharacterised protein [Mycobacteroides abscessus subsp. abscessus]|nr:Uncharacterised protein [Mycobacteroides abscessus subsp. abscessus]